MRLVHKYVNANNEDCRMTLTLASNNNKARYVVIHEIWIETRPGQYEWCRNNWKSQIWISDEELQPLITLLLRVQKILPLS